jgi:hypothetical protein
MDQAVTDYIARIEQPWQAEVSRRLRQFIHQAVPDAGERIQYGKPHFLKDGKYVAVLGTAKGWVSLTIFNASTIEAPDGLFEPGGSPDRKTIKFREDQSVDDDLVVRLLLQAVQAR